MVNLLHQSVRDRSYDMIPTAKNRNSRRKYGLTMYDLENYFMSITEEDLYAGPLGDMDFPGEELFIFKKEMMKNVIFYVKIKKDSREYDRIKILSCHEDELGGM